MKKALLKDTFKEIANTKKRFISIILMAFLGVGFFAGIKATSPDMQKTLDNYYDQNNVYDIEIISTLGLTDEDIESLEKIDEVEKAYGIYSVDVAIEANGEEVISKVYSIDENINKTILISGDMPQNYNECLVEEKFLTNNNLEIGDYIELDTKSDEEFFKDNKVKIVGTVESPLYISRTRGSTKLGSGTIDYYMYISKENITSEAYTEIYITVKNAKELNSCEDEYEDYISEVKNKIEQIKEEREQARYNSIVSEAQSKIDEAKEELNAQKEDAQQQIYEAEVELQNAKNQIDVGKSNLSNQKTATYKQLEESKSQLELQKQNLEQSKQEFQQKEKEAIDQIANLNEQLNILKEDEELNAEQIKQLESSIAYIQSELDSAKAMITQGENEITNGEQQLELATQTANSEFANAQAKINSAESEYNEGVATLENKKQELNEKIQEAEEKIAEAENDVKLIETAKWYILERFSNSGFSSFVQDTQSVANLGKVFPIVFFVIAILISLTSMTRMVEEQRGEIGTLKTLGYTGLQIANKYIIYAVLACVIGGFIGVGVGFVLIPKVIWRMYSLMYKIPNFVIEFNFYYAFIGICAITACILGATIASIKKEIKQTPAVLMRPKPPTLGKRVLLENIRFIWERLNFIQKITVRNMFRYKKRFLLTVIGILGSTSLILTGFGLRDSITSLIPEQYGNIFKYDMMITIKSELTEEELAKFRSDIEDKSEVEKTVEVCIQSMEIYKDISNYESAELVVAENIEDFYSVIELKDKKTKEKIELNNNEIIITDKLSELINVKSGEEVILRNSDGEEVKATIGAITKNNINHYIYMTKDLYNNLYGNYETNVIYTKNIELTEEQENNLAKQIMDTGCVAGITTTSNAKSIVDDMISALNYVVIVLITSSGLLAFAVLYNLANVNISERIRELATIKVLGFYDKEVYDYLNRETIILTIVGIILGLVGGYFLSYFIMGTCEVQTIRFDKVITIPSYIYATLITIAFTFIVNISTYFNLKKIKMIESLKSVE